MNDSPKSFTFDEIKLGQKIAFEITIDENLLNDFAKISGDFNPIHMDRDFAISQGFQDRVCHGMLLSSFFSTIVGMHIPGKNSLLFSQSLKFRLPCFANETIEVTGVVIDKSISTKMVTMNTSIHNKSGQCLVEGETKAIVRE